jgi:hypothetical protein
VCEPQPRHGDIRDGPLLSVELDAASKLAHRFFPLAAGPERFGARDDHLARNGTRLPRLGSRSKASINARASSTCPASASVILAGP